MCGITLLAERDGLAPPSLLHDERLADAIKHKLSQRGPDHFDAVDRSVGSASAAPAWKFRLCSAVLHLRGDAITPQPMEDAAGNVLCWNGEVFGFDGGIIDEGNDTKWLSEQLHDATQELQDDAVGVTQRTVSIFQRIHGPFAFVWLHAATGRLFFGHDRFGRRSLLAQVDHTNDDDSDLLTTLATDAMASNDGTASVQIDSLQRLILSSVSLASDQLMQFQEVPATGVFVFDLHHQRLEFHAYTSLVPPQQSPSIPLVQDLYDCGLPLSASSSRLDQAAASLLTALSNSVGVRIRTIPRSHPNTRTARVGVLFSGGLDSVVLAGLAHFHVTDPLEPIDLLNVCFDSATRFQSPDRLAAQIAYSELRTLFPSRQWNLVRVDVEYQDAVARHSDILTLLTPCDTQMDLNIGTAFWFLSRGQGSVDSSGDSKVVDASVDLNGFLSVNRATNEQQEGERALQALGLFGTSSQDPQLCPANKCKRKRKPGCSLGICRVCCLKLQRLVSVLRDCQQEEDQENHGRLSFASRKQLIALLPSQSTDADAVVESLLRVCDAHWPVDGAICRVHRVKIDPDQAESTTQSTADHLSPSRITPSAPYTTTARVLLVGIGADEQLGGYGRHKTAFMQRGIDGLRGELAKDMTRIWKRNLGRDDRCISAHGREARFPFLDEGVVRLIAALPLDCVCDFEQPRGAGDKLVLRLVARALGLSHCAGLAKRAIQFGTRIAKHANVAAFGSNRQASGVAKIQSPHGDDDGEE